MIPLVITICATDSYAYAMKEQANRVLANIGSEPTGRVIIAGDGSKSIGGVVEYYKDLLPEGWEIEALRVKDAEEGGANYKEQAQLLIARLRTAAFNRARKLRAVLTWSLDSDVLPPANALRCMKDMLRFDDGFYSISTCPYPNGAFLGGRGSPRKPIADDFLPHERKLPDDLRKEFEANEAELKSLIAEKRQPTPEQFARWEATNQRIKECPPDGNIFEVNGKHGWRPRGWLDHAYPAIGLGSVVPSDWCGFGCTLLNSYALAHALFEGYDGKGTEDLFVVWHRWYPAGLRINVITHCPCDHVIWERKKGGDPEKFTHIRAYHETEGDCVGHLRTRSQPWIPTTRAVRIQEKQPLPEPKP